MHSHIFSVTVSAQDAPAAREVPARKLPVPTYRIVATRGQAHAQTFDVECAVPALGLAELGEGRSRRIAEQEAARCMLDKLKASDRPGGPLRA